MEIKEKSSADISGGREARELINSDLVLDKKLPDYLNVNVRRLRKCPRCGSKHYERSMENLINIVMNNGRLESKSNLWSDAGSTWKCLECYLHIFQDGSWETSKSYSHEIVED